MLSAATTSKPTKRVVVFKYILNTARSWVRTLVKTTTVPTMASMSSCLRRV